MSEIWPGLTAWRRRQNPRRPLQVDPYREPLLVSGGGRCRARRAPTGDWFKDLDSGAHLKDGSARGTEGVSLQFFKRLLDLYKEGWDLKCTLLVLAIVATIAVCAFIQNRTLAHPHTHTYNQMEVSRA